MIRWLRSLNIDRLSFWIGFVTATVFWVLIRFLLPWFKKLWKELLKGVQSARQGLQTSAEQRHRNDTLKYVQGLHLASSFFSLDEVLIQPRLLAPPPIIQPNQPPPSEDAVSMSIPYAPDWPELTSAFGGHTLSITEVLQEGSNIVLIGPPGSGKTSTLAHLASQIARHDPETGTLKDSLPIYIHAADLNLPTNEKDSLTQVVYDAISYRASVLSQPRLPGLLETFFKVENVTLLLDGLDELAPEPLQETIDFLGQILEEYPGTRVVAAASPDSFSSLPKLGLAPVPMAIWDGTTQAKFIHQWGKLWDEFINDEGSNTENYVDPLLLNGWLINLEAAITPLDFTLKVWAVYAGDVRGPSQLDSIEAYLLRSSVGISKARAGLEQLAGQVVSFQQIRFDQGEAQNWISGGVPESQEKTEEPEIYEVPDPLAVEKPKDVTISRVIPDLTRNGLLVRRANNKLSFVHPLIVGYLAGHALSPSNIQSQSSWPMKNLTFQYMASTVNLGDLAGQFLSNAASDPIFRDTLSVGRWLPGIPQDAAWRKQILQRLSGNIQKENLPMGVRSRILTALAASGDPGIPTLFRHFLTSHSSNLRQLAALGCGYVRDTQSVGELVRLLGDDRNVSTAVCLALVNIGTKPALEAIASALIQGSEELRRAAAEALANHPVDGYPTLREGSTVDDILVRRAVIFGLKRVNQPWSLEILEEMQIEDAQWVVKNAAAQTVEEIYAVDPHIPQPVEPLHDLPWLIEFASERGVGVSPETVGKMVLQALKEGNEDQKLAAMGIIQQRGETAIFPEIYHIIFSTDTELSDAAFNTIWHLAGMGETIPSPAQYGLG